ncbi:MAG: AAA family ATPase [Patescibacteria group bacterium]
MSYGIVPVLHASAGVQRIIALAYFLVWAWYEHLALTSRMRREPQRRIILLIDEIEAHLHPRWQRVIVPALMAAVEKIEASVALQIHLATHSPLVLASAETTFSSKTDCLHHLSLEANTVRLETLEFVKRGRADLWLMSSVFGLAQPRSVPAEAAMHDAKSLQLKGESDPKVIAEVHARLKANLPQDDEFWPRWLYWAEQRGVKD